MEPSKEQKTLQRVISEAWNNPSYKQDLIDNPEEAVRRLTGESLSLPEGKTLEVYDQSDSAKVYLNIPPQPDLDDVELSDEQLEEVAGGVIPIIFIEGCFPIWPPYPFPLPSPTIPESNH